ncbi:FtsX-like permease family protein [Conexibacter woesei]|uniref:ABC3 transporter permease protein domain-containing protein n=1 Tax=Conexibacter woesei (strain DSM 14684 / CCUG 47730 / CIP 108061 / JCM 11494 / NBRC 100937 / ID131577) TaxID=469383 RepID=D3FA49_CONWI|nr:FtsX-like permease family protein [Conexibacter woesei]ADB53144.1 protein of unknown function DUF214 [Conexibacter woesei DSM 14684]
MRLRNLLFLSAQRTRSHALQELLALAGIAVGVGLVFAVLVANASVAGSVRELARGIVGDGTLQLTARGTRGLDAGVARDVARLPEVATSAAMIETRVELRGPRGSRTTTLLGADGDAGAVGGPLLRELAPPRPALSEAVALTSSTARDLGVRAGERVRVTAAGHSREAPVAVVLGRDRIGSLAGSPLVLAPLGFAQRLAGLRGRVTRVLAEPRPGRATALRARLERLATGDVTTGTEEARRLGHAMGPNDRATALFAAVSALVGLLLAFNAMLLTVPERRRFISDLRVDGLGDATVVRLVVVDALVLGTAASAVGLLLGELLSRSVFDAVPGYIALAFTVGEQRVVTAAALLVAVGGGIAATVLAALRPLADVASRRPLDAVRRDEERGDDGRLPRRRLLACGVATGAAATLLLALAPATALAVFGLLVVAMGLTIPAALAGVLRLLRLLSRRLRSPVLVVSLGELRASPTRSLALAATAALAVFGSVAVEGSHRDLLDGIDSDARGMSGQADLWVMGAQPDNALLTADFRLSGRRLAALAQVPGVAALRPYRAALLDVDGARAWVLGPPADGAPPLLRSQLAVPGQLAVATRRLRAGGWVALSRELVERRGLRVGDAVSLPTPRAVPLRLAAVLTNIAWSGGGAVMGGEDFRRAWGGARVGALQIELAPGAAAGATAAALRRALPPGAGLRVATAAQRRRLMTGTAAQGLDRLTQIAALVLIAGALALAAALGAVAWARRPRLAALKLTGFGDGAVWRALLLESAIVLGVGCSIGVAFGLAGQYVLTYWLRVVAGFPTSYAVAGWLALAVFAGVTAVAGAIAALPGWAAARVSPLLSTREE